VSLFLEPDELVTLTGRKAKSKQIEWLRKAGVPFRVNATGHPVVTRSAVDGKPEPVVPARNWTPRAVGYGT
jgi:hypothetical protein